MINGRGNKNKLNSPCSPFNPKKINKKGLELIVKLHQSAHIYVGDMYQYSSLNGFIFTNLWQGGLEISFPGNLYVHCIYFFIVNQMTSSAD